ncbi:CBS domain-containing protein [Azospirillum halopraeferens]|uniref:CBS domain-containing protein n=1 Tax=Azospirillum halopraeferens TaxID=34010 RepID=UPI0004189ABF|nr:CBS domain-containing protein [Azospirillum halopraeferens]
MMHRHVGDLLSSRHVVSLPPDSSVRLAATRMKAAHVASVVVTDGEDGHLEGIFTERDLTERVVAGGLDPDGTALSVVMTPCPITVDVDTSMRDALRRMFLNGLRHLPVVHGGKVVGILSMRDFMGEELAQLDRERELVESLTEVL